MQHALSICIRSGLAALLLGGVIAADSPTPTRSTLPPPMSQEDAALRLASRSAAPALPQEEKKSPWWSVFSFSSKKTSAPLPSPDTPVDLPSTGTFKSTKADTTPMPGSKKTNDSIDGGQAEVTATAREKQYSEVDYVASATTPKDTKARNLYHEGLLAESQGRHMDAVRAYNGFIKANERSTTNGVLAAPYHRLALISWKGGNIADAEIYFRYALNYALGGNLLIIGGDFSQFLMMKGEYAKAEIILRNALINDPENKRLLLYLGRCVAVQRKHQESLRYLVASVGRARAYQELAAVYRQQGDFELARVAEEKRDEHLAAERPQLPLEHSRETRQEQQTVTPVQTTAHPTWERLPNPSDEWTPSNQPS